jgi:cation diffusion facilitator CzcD-associated flavoprotein CzcO
VTLTRATTDAGAPGATEHVDVLILGAGISGIGAAHHLREQCPDKSFLLLETMGTFGGTWVTHHYPGARSDSDLYTFGYRFKPWTGPPIATADEILEYLADVVAADRLEERIRYRTTVTDAAWSTDERRWTVECQDVDTGERWQVTCGFFWMCQGYYRHDRPYTPAWPGFERFAGTVVHPQHWPDGIDLSGKRVVVIGSGATAATLIPNIAGTAEHVTMLQRSPTFFITGRNQDDTANMLRELEVPEEWIHEIVRRQRIRDLELLSAVAKDAPDFAREELLRPLRELVGESVDVDVHFNPRYRPWQQRIAFVPDADLFEAIRRGDASVVTDEIERFEADGIVLRSGERLAADVVVTATGFDLSVLGDVAVTIDGAPLDFPSTVSYRGMMFTGVPNLCWVFGYFRFSWTLRVDLLGDFVCRLLQHMDELGASMVVPELRAEDADMQRLPWVDPENFNPGYVTRSLHLMPAQGDRDPWRHVQDYAEDKRSLPAADLDDGALLFK